MNFTGVSNESWEYDLFIPFWQMTEVDIQKQVDEKIWKAYLQVTYLGGKSPPAKLTSLDAASKWPVT